MVLRLNIQLFKFKLSLEPSQLQPQTGSTREEQNISSALSKMMLDEDRTTGTRKNYWHKTEPLTTERATDLIYWRSFLQSDWSSVWDFKATRSYDVQSVSSLMRPEEKKHKRMFGQTQMRTNNSGPLICSATTRQLRSNTTDQKRRFYF